MQTDGVLGTTWTAIQALPAWQGSALVVGAALVAAVVLRVGGDRVLRRVTEHIPGDVDDVVLRGVHPAIYLTVAIGGAFVGATLFDLTPDDADAVRATALSLVAVVWTVTLVRVGRAVSRSVTDTRYVDRQVVPIFQNVWSAVVVLAGVLAVLALWRIDVTPLLASAGIVGIVAGLAARDTVANLFGSISLYLDGTYRVGDYVVLETGERGRVEDISVRSTVIRTRDDVLVTVPNSVLNNAAIVNESSPRRRRRIRVPVGVAYGSDVDEIESILVAAATDAEQVLDRPEPRVRFRSFGGSALEFELLCWIPNPALRARVVHELNSAIYRAFQDAGVEIPFPQRDVRVSLAEKVALPESGAPADAADDASRTAGA